MEFQINEWLGKWDNFEDYIDSSDPDMQAVWQEAEAFCQKLPMFSGGVRDFWRRACHTATEENPVRLKGWEISPVAQGMEVEWLGAKGQSLGKYSYAVDRVVKKGLEGKENFLFCAVNAPEGCPFRYLLSMAPMPERRARLQGGFLSHLHFQYGGDLQKLLKEDGGLQNPGWYATMCAGEGTLSERCNVIRGLHRLPGKAR